MTGVLHTIPNMAGVLHTIPNMAGVLHTIPTSDSAWDQHPAALHPHIHF